MILAYRYINIDEKTSRAEVSVRQSEAAVELLFQILDDCGIKERAVERDKNGRPFLVGRDDVDFNISHSGNMVVCVLSVGEGRVGVDVEKNNTALPPEHRERFLKRYFEPDEISGDPDLAKMWTGKEAYLKYLGTGLSGGVRLLKPYADERVKIENFYIGDYTVSVCAERGRKLDLTLKAEPQVKLE